MKKLDATFSKEKVKYTDVNQKRLTRNDSNASVTFVLRRVYMYMYDARTMSKSVWPPQGDLTTIVRICGHRSLYDYV